ncbi:MAG: PAS domain S-box protein [Chloroflexi bacterium]|nr:PAS domain S-box protein [Chloroflexota bacterium]
MTFSQRQATVFVLGFQFTSVVLLEISQILEKQADGSLILGAGLAIAIYGGMLFAYLRGWEYARHISVLLMSVIVGVFLPEPFVTGYAPFLILLGPILALVILTPNWVIGSAVVTYGILLLRSDGTGVYAGLATILNYAMLIAGLVVSRMVTESVRDGFKKTEEALYETQAHVAGIINSAMDGIISMDDTQRILIFNPAAEAMFGYRADEVKGQPLGMLLPESFRSEHRLQVRRFGQTGITNRHMKGHLNTSGMRRNGDIFPVDASISKVDLGGKKIFTAILRDITDDKRAMNALLESEGKFRHTLDAMLEGCQILDMNWKYLYINDIAEKHNRRPKTELLGRKYMEMWPGIETTEVFALIRQCLENRESQSMENKFEFPDGDSGWFELRIYPVPEGVVILSVDITERKLTEEEIRKLNENLEKRIEERTAELSDLYNHAPCGYHSINGEGVIVRINETELDWLGYKREELVGKINITDLLSSSSIEVFKRNFPVFKETGILNDLELELVRKNGTILPILLSATAVRNHAGKYVESRTTLIDYTDRKQIEQEMLNSKLQLEAANKELEAFSYSVSHDLRSPLRGIDGWSLALLEDYGYLLDDQGQSHIQRVRAETQRMGALIDDILELSRITRAEMKKENVDLTRIAETVRARLLETNSEDRRVEIIIQDGLNAKGDPKLLDVVLTNLLGNSFKFTSKTPEAQIEFGKTLVDGKPAFFVRDNGAGFDMAYADKLFGAFQRMHRVSEFPGTGVGLATVQRIIHRHGGRIWATSQTGQGATFYFTLEEF